MFSIALLRPRLVLHGLLPLLGALTLMGLVACGPSSPSSTGSPTAPPQTPTQSQQVNDFGPLAVIEEPGGDQARGGIGPIDIGEDCVTMLRENGESVLLVWHSAEVSWDSESREITYTSFGNRGDSPITIGDGDIITVGGVSLLDDVPVERDLTWLATPHPTCPGGPWAVFGVTKETTAASEPGSKPEPWDELVKNAVLAESSLRPVFDGKIAGVNYTWEGISQSSEPIHRRWEAAAAIVFAEPFPFSGRIPRAPSPCDGGYEDEQLGPDHPCLDQPRQVVREDVEYASVRSLVVLVDVEQHRVMDVTWLDFGVENTPE